MRRGKRWDIVFAGAGHAHLPALREVGELLARGMKVALVAPEKFWYSGMGPGMLGGTYTPEEDSIDAAAWLEEAGADVFREPVQAIERASKELQLLSGRVIPFRVLSLNVGSQVPLDSIAGGREFAVPVKPVQHLAAVGRRLESPGKDGRKHRLAVLGGGPSGCEVVGNALLRARLAGTSLEVSLVCGRRGLLPAFPARGRQLMKVWLEDQGVEIIAGARVQKLSQGLAELQDGRTLDWDTLVAAIGVRPNPLIAAAGLAVDDDGAMLVDENLQSISDRGVFGGGDCVTPSSGPLAKVGVYAVRQAPILRHNVCALALGEPLRAFRPQRRFLLILNLGDGTGLLSWGALALRSRWAFRLKDYLDRAFLRRFTT